MTLFFLFAGPELPPLGPVFALLARFVIERERLLPRPAAEAERERLAVGLASAGRGFHTTFGSSVSIPSGGDDDGAAAAAEDIVV